MLHQLSIQNFATVDSLDIEFQPGMSVITGETGAGKSIMLGALGLALGDRADKGVVRGGAKRADISATFDTAQIASARQWLAEMELDDGESDLCILRRVIGNDGRSRGFINGAPATMANLKSLGEMLVDIHSQHEHQSLLQRATQQRLLDDFCVDSKLLERLRSTWKQWQQNHQDLEQLRQQAEEYSAQSQLLSYQLDELTELALEEDEVEALEAEFKVLHHAEETLEAVRHAASLCAEDDEHNASSLLHQALTRLKDLPDNEKLQGIIKLMEGAQIQLGEALTDLRSFHDSFAADPARLEAINERLSALHAIARKHKVQAGQLPALAASLSTELDRYQHGEDELDRLQANEQLLTEQYLTLARELSEQRLAGASELTSKVNEQLNQLGMPHATLEVKLTTSEGERPSPNGLESTEFLVCTNPGQPPQPLLKIASGGELSRISLAIQVITAQTSQTPSLVFDEVDVGIGGGVAKVVGRLLRQLGESTQILVVTHQAQVAGQGQQHFFVSKHSDGASTLTRIEKLQGESVVREVARMLGGDEVSEESLAHAEQMVAAP